MIYLYMVVRQIFNAALILATGYVVFGLNQSGWWFLLTIIFITITSIGTTEKKARNEK